MPIHEYVCEECREEFEELVRGDETVACPRCGSVRAAKKFSAFATARAGGGAQAGPSDSARHAAPGGCGTCGDPRGPGSCAS
ncbi:MAG: zinc ribbon domain-containing protein [Planctomycetota bacterium]|nr:zinc ribbon domain-containing protein [Planctomycetota bacterium]